MTHVAAYQDPAFSQFLPEGVAWQLVGPCYFGALRYRDPATGAEAVVPNIWYNQTVEMRTRAMRFYADRADEGAARLESAAAGAFPKPWELDSARRQRADAVRLRNLAEEMERTGRVLA